MKNSSAFPYIIPTPINNFLFYGTTADFSLYAYKQLTMARLLDSPHNTTSPRIIPACQHVGKTKKEKFIFLRHLFLLVHENTWNRLCVDCFNTFTRPNLPPDLPAKFHIPDPPPSLRVHIV